jgi:hypothetical protein
MSIRGAIVMSGGMGQMAAADTGNAGWVTLKVSRVQVKPKKIDGTAWDLKDDQRSGGCGSIALIGKVIGTAVGGTPGGAVGSVVGTIFCSQSAQIQQGRESSAPDLFVQVMAGDAKYRTWIALDTFAEVFDFSVIVPLEGIPAAGLEIQVLDQDQDIGAGELIGLEVCREGCGPSVCDRRC